MKRGDFVSLAKLDFFSASAYGIIVNDKCTEGFVVVAYDTDDFKFRLNVRCELVEVIAPPKFKVGDKVTNHRTGLDPMPDTIFEIVGFRMFYYDDIWLYTAKIPDEQHWRSGPANDFTLVETETV